MSFYILLSVKRIKSSASLLDPVNFSFFIFPFISPSQQQDTILQKELCLDLQHPSLLLSAEVLYSQVEVPLCLFHFSYYFAIFVLNPILSSAVPMITNIMALPPDCTMLPLTEVKKDAVNPNIIPSAI